MKNRSIIRIMATLILTVIFSESVMANVIVNNVEAFIENIAEVSDGEHTEEAVETTTDYVNSVADGVITPSAVDTAERTEKSTLTELNSVIAMDDIVVSDSAIDFEVDTEGIPDYALELAESNSRYSELDNSSKFYLNRYIGVREDTMTECEYNGLTIKESIPMALLMQRLKFDYSSAVDMVINYGSQTAALNSAMEYREKEFEIGFLSQDNIKPELVNLLKVGYSTDELIESFAVSKCVGMPVREIITKDENKIIDSFENTVISLTPVFNPFGTGLMSVNKEEKNGEQEDITNTDAIEIANEHYVKAECILGYMESNNITAEEMEIEILAKKVELDIVDESEIDTVLNGIQAYSEATGEIDRKSVV